MLPFAESGAVARAFPPSYTSIGTHVYAGDCASRKSVARMVVVQHRSELTYACPRTRATLRFIPNLAALRITHGSYRNGHAWRATMQSLDARPRQIVTISSAVSKDPTSGARPLRIPKPRGRGLDMDSEDVDRRLRRYPRAVEVRVNDALPGMQLPGYCEELAGGEVLDIVGLEVCAVRTSVSVEGIREGSPGLPASVPFSNVDELRKGALGLCNIAANSGPLPMIIRFSKLLVVAGSISGTQSQGCSS
ncbi:hypothetical protein C8Q78DRAFT_241085 [Trametes maxima]|nr:hypothetical protein C8Q78DRAFT_241085 [Trametes maxima]